MNACTYVDRGEGCWSMQKQRSFKCIHTHLYIVTNMNSCTHTYICILFMWCWSVHIRTYAPICIHEYEFMHTYIHLYTIYVLLERAHTHICRCAHRCFLSTHIHTYMHTRIWIHAHLHMCSLVVVCQRFSYVCRLVVVDWLS